jgi:hypothetical protein
VTIEIRREPASREWLRRRSLKRLRTDGLLGRKEPLFKSEETSSQMQTLSHGISAKLIPKYFINQK